MTTQEFRNLVSKVRTTVRDKHGELFLEDEKRGEKESAVKAEIRAILNGNHSEELERRILSHILGFGEIEPYMKDQKISEIMINGLSQVFIEKNSKMELTNTKFHTVEDLMDLLRRLVQSAGRRVDYTSPIVNARMPDGSRVNAVIMPNALQPTITIRKFVQHKFTAEELLRQSYLSNEMLTFFDYVVKGKVNIVVSGASGSGKTTFMRFLSSLISPEERLIVIEDTRELDLDNEHVISLEASDKIGVYDLMVNALRMRGDRIILGEGRGMETFELLQAMGTGHEGSITSIHANHGKKETVQRLVRAMIKSGMSDQELTKHILNTIDLTLFIKKYRDGTRRIISVSEIADNNGEPLFRDIYRYDQQEKKHIAVGSLSQDLIERVKDNIGSEALPDMLPFRGD